MTTQPLSEKIELKEVSDAGSLTYEKRFILYRADVKQAIQKTLKELKDRINGTCLGKTNEDDIAVRKAIFRIIDTTFKKNFGGLAE